MTGLCIRELLASMKAGRDSVGTLEHGRPVRNTREELFNSDSFVLLGCRPSLQYSCDFGTDVRSVADSLATAGLEVKFLDLSRPFKG